MNITKKCCVDGCNNKSMSKGYCSKHYAQVKKWGRVTDNINVNNYKYILSDNCVEITIYNKGSDDIKSVCKIDLEDMEVCKNHKWHLLSSGYFATRINDKIVLLHRLITNCDDDLVVDHINKDKLDNRKSNLRICKQQENCCNGSKSINNTSGIIGVTWDKNRNKWQAQIMINYCNKILGRYIDKNDAIITRLKAELEYFGEFAPQKHLFEQYNIRGNN